jgi:hypothetical protein
MAAMFDWIVWTPVTMWMVGKAVAILVLLLIVNIWYTVKTGRILSEDWPNPQWPRRKVTGRPRTKEAGYSEAELE